MIDRLTEMLNEKVPINLGSLKNSFDKIAFFQDYYEEDYLEDGYLSSYIEGMIGQKFVSIVYTPCNEENIGEYYDVSDSDEVIIALLKTEVHNKEYYKSGVPPAPRFHLTPHCCYTPTSTVRVY